MKAENSRTIFIWIVFIFIATIPLQVVYFIYFFVTYYKRLCVYDYELLSKNYNSNLAITIYIFLSILFFYTIIKMIKNNKRKIDKIFSSLFIFALYLILIIPVTGILSGINLFINCNFGKQEIIKVNGIIISKFKNESYRDRSCKFDLLVSNKKIILKTSPEIYKKYKLNDTINIYMIKGSKGIIYERY